MTTPRVDPKTLEPGTVIRHTSGGIVILKKRKDDDSGWWNTDGSGLTDSLWKKDDCQWRVVERERPEFVVARALKRLYPQNPDVVLGREARTIVAYLDSAGYALVPK